MDCEFAPDAAARATHAQLSSAGVSLRFGRNPYDEARKSASKMGSRVAAISATRSVLSAGLPGEPDAHGGAPRAVHGDGDQADALNAMR